MGGPGAAVRAIGEAAGAAAAAGDGEQLDLVALLPDARFPEIVQPGGAARLGRPIGARNIRTRQTVDFVRRMFGDPMVESARWLLLRPEVMARELSCSTFDAFQAQEAIRRDLRRYMHPAMAAVDASGAAVVPFLQLVIGGEGASGAPGAAPWLSAPGMSHIEQNQTLSGEAPATSHAAASHDQAKPLETEDKSLPID
jgi:hypothetical protein